MYKSTRRRAFAVFILASSLFGQTASEQFRQFLDGAFEEQLKESPGLAASFGRTEGTGRWMDLSPEGIARRKARWRRLQSDLKRFDRNELSEADRLNYDLFAYQIERVVEAARYPADVLVVDQLFSGPQITVPSTLRLRPANTVQHYEILLDLLRAAPRYVDQHIALLQQGVREGITHPAIILREIPEQIDKLISGAPQDSQFLAAFQRFPASIPDSERRRLTREAAALVDAGVFPAFHGCVTTWQTSTFPKHVPPLHGVLCQTEQRGTPSMRASTPRPR